MTPTPIELKPEVSAKRITESHYNKKREEFRGKQKEISGKIASLGIAH